MNRRYYRGLRIGHGFDIPNDGYHYSAVEQFSNIFHDASVENSR
jgi:hypothetical protein